MFYFSIITKEDKLYLSKCNRQLWMLVLIMLDWFYNILIMAQFYFYILQKLEDKVISRQVQLNYLHLMQIHSGIFWKYLKLNKTSSSNRYKLHFNEHFYSNNFLIMFILGWHSHNSKAFHRETRLQDLFDIFFFNISHSNSLLYFYSGRISPGFINRRVRNGWGTKVTNSEMSIT